MPVGELKLNSCGEAVEAALKNRLDLATERDQLEDAGRDVYIARNALLPNLTLDASYGIFSAGTDAFTDLAFDSDTITITAWANRRCWPAWD